MKTSLLFFCLFSLSCVGQIVTTPFPEVFGKTDLQQMKMQGKVKSIQTTSFTAIKKSGVIQEGKRKTENPNWETDTYEIFNTDGNKNELSYGIIGGSLRAKFAYEYNDSDKIKELSISNPNKKDSTNDSKFTYKYDDKGKIIELDRTNSKGILAVWETYKYDNRGNIIERNLTFNGKPSKDSLVYDEKNNVIEQYATNFFFPGIWKYTYKYDDKGNRTEENWFKQDGKFYMKYDFKYDDKGNWSEVTWTNARGKSCKWTFQYECDANGNWTKSIQFLNGKANYILEREIEYF